MQKARVISYHFRESLRPAARIAVLLRATALVVLLFIQVKAAETEAKTAGGPSRTVIPNRTLPRVQPPETTLQFSENPTTQEIFHARVFQEPLVPIGGEPEAGENAALAAALLSYAKRDGPDDFASLTSFLDKHPKSPWRASLLTGLGLEYYNTAHYSLAIEAWSNALRHRDRPTNVEGMVVLARAAEELALLYARLGRMTELEKLLKSMDAPGASQNVKRAQEALWLMQHRPEISFRCGPLALQSILRSDQKLLASCATNALMEIFNSASTQKGISLPQVADLSKKMVLPESSGEKILARIRVRGVRGPRGQGGA